MTHLLAGIQLPPYPGAVDLKRLLPEIIVGSLFLVLMMADLVVPASRRGLLAALSVAGYAGAFGAVIYAWFDAGDQGALAYNGTFAYDRFSLFADGLVLACGLLVTLISPGYLNRRGLHFGEFYGLIAGSVLGMMILAGAMNLMVIFLGLELLSVALYILSGFAHTEERSQEAGLKYLLLGGFASGFLLYGMALVYGETGHTNLTDISRSLTATGGQTDPLFLIGVTLMLVGFGFKITAAPFHFWSPDVYQGAPTNVTTFMSVATKVAAFAALIRVFSGVFNASFDKWDNFVIFIAIVSMVLGNVAALTQTSVKRLLAYSGIAQAGYILIGVAVNNPAATTASLFYLAAYAAMNLGAFAVITLMAGRGEDIDDYASLRGLYYRRPYIAGAMALFLFSLGGFPPTVGFFAKFFVFSAAIQNGQVSLALWGIATSAVSVYYYLRIGALMFTRPKEGESGYEWSRTGVLGGTVILVTVGSTVALGVLANVLYDVSSQAAASLPNILVPHT